MQIPGSVGSAIDAEGASLGRGGLFQPGADHDRAPRSERASSSGSARFPVTLTPKHELKGQQDRPPQPLACTARASTWRASNCPSQRGKSKVPHEALSEGRVRSENVLVTEITTINPITSLAPSVTPLRVMENLRGERRRRLFGSGS